MKNMYFLKKKIILDICLDLIEFIKINFRKEEIILDDIKIEGDIFKDTLKIIEQYLKEK